MPHLTRYFPEFFLSLSREEANQGKETSEKAIVKILKGNGFFFVLTMVALLFYLRFDLFYIKTGSMEPNLPVGSIVAVDPYARPEVGDIFAYRSGGLVVIHRMVAEDDEGYTFKGDANVSPDISKVTDEQLIGKVTLKLTFPARIVRWIARCRQDSDHERRMDTNG